MEVLLFIIGVGFGVSLASLVLYYTKQNEEEKHRKQCEEAYLAGYDFGYNTCFLETTNKEEVPEND